MKRRDVKESNVTREVAYTALETVEIPNHKYLGRVAEGLVFENEDGLCMVIKAIAKSPDFDGEFEVTDYEESLMAKEKEKAEKKAKAEKAKAKKKKEKEEEGE